MQELEHGNICKYLGTGESKFIQQEQQQQQQQQMTGN